MTALPELVRALALANTPVTLDVMGCQPAMAPHRLNRPAEDRLVLQATPGRT